jgi:hypothetical protein
MRSSLHDSKAEALKSTKKDLAASEPAGALYPTGAVRWRFRDGTMAVCHRWSHDCFLMSWIFDR